jgi:hypothetical protein
MTKKAGSGSESGSGFISQRNGSADPDPHQNVLDPEHCLLGILPMTQGGSFRECHGPVVVHTSRGSPFPMSCLVGTTISARCSFVSSFEAVHFVQATFMLVVGTLFKFSTTLQSVFFCG